MRHKLVAAVAVVTALVVGGALPASADHVAGSTGGECYAGPFSGTGIPVDLATPWMAEWTRRDGSTVLFCLFVGLPASVAWDDPANAPGIDYTAPTRPVWRTGVLCEKGEFEYGTGTFLNLPGGVALLACEWPAPEAPSRHWGFGNRPARSGG